MGYSLGDHGLLGEAPLNSIVTVVSLQLYRLVDLGAVDSPCDAVIILVLEPIT